MAIRGRKTYNQLRNYVGAKQVLGNADKDMHGDAVMSLRSSVCARTRGPFMADCPSPSIIQDLYSQEFEMG
jgi:hypothetical protein